MQEFGTIAHECIHSTQNKPLLLFNFIISNINILLFLLLLGLTVFRTIEINMVLVLAFTFMVLVQFSARVYLEVDAMKRGRILAEEYIDIKMAEENFWMVSQEEKNKLLKSYDKINEIGIPVIIDLYFTKSIIVILICVVVGLIMD